MVTEDNINKDPPEEDSKNVDTEDETERTFRCLSIISYFLVLVVLGIPVWWYTTRVYRAPLPLNEIGDLQLHPQNTTEFGIPLSLEYDILISFINPDPKNLKVTVEPLEIDAYLQENFVHKLAPVAQLHVKSQWLYLTELNINAAKINDHVPIYEHDLPYVITPLETKLWTNVSPRPSINLVVYFSHSHAPLHIYHADNKSKLLSNSFISPRWGGVYIVNPTLQGDAHYEYKAHSKQIFRTFYTMLLELFKIESSKDASITDFKIKKTHDMIESSKRTLKSLAQLLSEINSIVISDNVAEQITVALESVKMAEEFREKGDIDNALAYAKEAFKNSEEAFAHPSLLALLYFPDDQKYAIYIPLFLPVMIPVIMSLAQITKKKNPKLKTL
ncbi:GPI transamidase component PIG-S [Anthonomus grandis grandis]|uniref:GPI transamidase component PIG-S n=1 Tax=Anthonomus grandis grandis TaxID=2921223 RepID=UPI0021667E0C|nr:GPI transamidase component PIG-S [Anthonomus grandis grandis]